MGAKDVLSHLPGGRRRGESRSGEPRSGATSAGRDTAVATAEPPPTTVTSGPTASGPTTSGPTSRTAPPRPAGPVRRNGRGDQGRAAPVTVNAATGDRVVRIHRIGAFVVAGVLATFGVLGFAGGLTLFDTEGQQVAGLSSNGLLSLISIATALVLVVAGIRGGRTASTVMFAVGVLFLLSAGWHLFVLNSGINFLAFTMANVIFSIVAGLVLLVLGAFGRVSGNLPRENPYLRGGGPLDADDDDEEEPELAPATAAERRAEREMREAEVAVAEHRATAAQRTLVQAMGQERTKAGRRRIWMAQS